MLVRRKQLDQYNKQFGLLISQAYENKQTGEIEYCIDKKIAANYEQIDRRKGRFLTGWVGDNNQIAVYAEIGKQSEVKRKVDEYLYYSNMAAMALDWIRQNSLRLGWKEDGSTYD